MFGKENRDGFCRCWMGFISYLCKELFGYYSSRELWSGIKRLVIILLLNGFIYLLGNFFFIRIKYLNVFVFFVRNNNND